MTALEQPTLTDTFELPYSPLLEVPVQTENGKIPAIELANRCLNSPYSTYMDTDQPLRFAEPYGYGPLHMVEDLGADVIPTGHQRLTGDFTAWVLRRHYDLHGSFAVPESEIGTVVLAGLLHDTGETKHPAVLRATGAVCGDIPYGKKTDLHRAIEAGVRTFVWGQTLPDVDPAVLARMEAIAAHADTTPCHEVYETAHDLTVFNTGLLAARSALRQLNLYYTGQPMTRTFAEVAQMRKLAEDVIASRWPSMLRRADELRLDYDWTIPLPRQPLATVL